MRILARCEIQFAGQVMIGRLLRLAIHAYYLLARRVRHACENARFCDCRITFIFQHSTERNTFVAEILQQQTSRLVVPHDTYGKDIHAEVGQIVHRIRAATGQNGSFTVLQDEYRRLARYA